MLPGCSFRCLVSVIASISWQDVIFVCQNESCDFLVNARQIEIPFQLYAVSYHNNTVMLYSILNTIAAGDSIHVVVIGDDDFLVAVLERANVQDALSGHHDMMIHRFEWIVFARGTSRIVEAVGNLTNVLAVQPQSYKEGCNSEVATALWSADGRRFSPVATWSDAGGLSVSSAFYPNRELGLNGRHLVVGTNTYDAFVRTEATDSGEVIFKGFCIELTKILAQKLNFTYTLQLPADGEWGVMDKNGSYSGLVGMLQNKVADIVIAPLSYTYDRIMVVDFADTALYIDETAILYKKPNSDEYLITMHYQPLKVSTWACVGCAILASTVVLWGIRIVSHDTTGAECGLTLGTRSFHLIFSAILCQGNSVSSLPTKMPGRIIMFSWYIVVLVITATYTGNLIAFLTVVEEPFPFDSLEELANQDQYKCGTLGGTDWPQLFENGKNPTYQKIWQKMVQYNSTELFTTAPNHSYHVEMINRTKYAYMVDMLTAQSTIKLDPSYVTAKETFLPMLYSIALQKDSTYTAEINRIMQELHATGIMLQLEKTYMPKTPSEDSSQTVVTISFMHMQGILYLVAGGMVVSFLVLVIEICVHRWKYTQVHVASGR